MKETRVWLSYALCAALTVAAGCSLSQESKIAKAIRENPYVNLRVCSLKVGGKTSFLGTRTNWRGVTKSTETVTVARSSKNQFTIIAGDSSPITINYDQLCK